MAMMPALFDQGVLAYREKQYPAAIAHFTKALKDPQAKKLMILDSRAAAYEGMGNVKAALGDAKMCIDIAPTAIQGYLRSSKLFEQIHQQQRALSILNLALTKLPPSKHSRINLQLSSLQSRISTTPSRIDPLAVLPTEIFSYIMRIAADGSGSGEGNSMIGKKDNDFPLRVSGVCRGWRDAILGYQHLFERLAMGEKTPKEKMNAWFVRSNGNIKAVNWDRTSGRKSEAEMRDSKERDKSIWMAKQCLGLGDKLEDIRMRLELQGQYQIIHQNFGTPFTNLRHIDIRFSERNVLSLWKHAVSQLDMGLLADSSVCLETIRLEGVYISHRTTSGPPRQHAVIPPGKIASIAKQEYEDWNRLETEGREPKDSFAPSIARNRRQLEHLRSLELHTCRIDVPWDREYTWAMPLNILHETLCRADNLETLRLVDNVFASVQEHNDYVPLAEIEGMYIFPLLHEYKEVHRTMDERQYGEQLDLQPPSITRLQLPNLKKIAVSGISSRFFSFLDTLSASNVPFGKLESIHLNAIDFADKTKEKISILLNQLHNIQSIEAVGFAFAEFDSLLEISPLTCPKLQKLVFKRMSGSASTLLKIVKARRGGYMESEELEKAMESKRMKDESLSKDEGKDDMEVEVDNDKLMGNEGISSRKRKGKEALNQGGREKRIKLEDGFSRGTSRDNNIQEDIKSNITSSTSSEIQAESPTSSRSNLKPSLSISSSNSSGSGEGLNHLHMRICSLSIHDCENFEKEAEEWLKKSVPEFEVVWPAREKERFRDKMRR